MKFLQPLKRQLSRQGGYSLVELSVALAIIAVILVGGLLGTRQVLLSNSVNNQVKDSATVISKIQRQYTKQPSTAGASTSILAPLGIWPPERTSVDASNNWTIRGVLAGSTEHVFANTAGIGTLPANGGFIYTLRGVPVDACAEVVTALDSMAAAIYAGESPESAPSSGATPGTTTVKAEGATQLNMTNLSTACKANTKNTVDVSILFRQ